MTTKRRTAAERQADAAEEAAIRHSLRHHRLAKDIADARRQQEAYERLDMQLRYGRSRRRRSKAGRRESRPAWTGRAR